MKCLFNGTGVAVVTPFKNGKVDYVAFRVLLKQVLGKGAKAVVILGTTGEGSTITEEERKELIKLARYTISTQAKLIVGTGNNNFEICKKNTQMAKDFCADGVLVVTPYYNKANENGLIEHYSFITKWCQLPTIVYNVPSRTGLNIKPESYAKLAENPFICAIKEASGNLAQAERTLSLCGDKIDIYSGSDELTVPFLSIGAKGIISVAANLIPKEIHELCSLYFEGKYIESSRKQIELIPLIDALFSDVNPIPVKEALNILGKDFGPCRLPLYEMEKLLYNTSYQ